MVHVILRGCTYLFINIVGIQPVITLLNHTTATVMIMHNHISRRTRSFRDCLMHVNPVQIISRDGFAAPVTVGGKVHEGGIPVSDVHQTAVGTAFQFAAQ